MNPVGMISVLLGLLMPSATHGGTKGTITRELAVNYTGTGSPDSFASLLFADKSYMYMICDPRRVDGMSCQVHVVKFDGPEEVHSFKYEPSPGRGIRGVFKPDFVRNGVFLLIFEYNLSDTDGIEPPSISGIVFNSTLDKVFELEFPSHVQFNQHFIGSAVESDELVVVLGDHTICGEFERCMLRFNNEGQKIGEPVLFPIQYNKLELLPRQEESVDEGLFGIGTINKPKSSFSQVFYVTANNTPIILHTFEYPITRSQFSNTRDLYGICEYGIHDEETGTIEYNCLQYDWKLNKTTHFNMNATLGKTEGSFLASIKNLNSNSLLFTTLECHREPRDANCRTARISVVNSYDQILRSKEIFTDLECHGRSLKSSGIAEINDEYCFYLSCLDAVQDPKQTYLNGGHLYVKCLPISDI